MRLGGSLTALLCLTAPVLLAQRPVTTGPITAADLRQRLFALSDDSMGGRASGSRGNFLGSQYVAAEFSRLGLEPAGDQGSYFQAVPFFYREIAAAAITAGADTLVLATDYVPVGRPTTASVLRDAAAVYGGPWTDSTMWPGADQLKGKVVVLTLPPGPDGSRRMRPGLQRVVANPRFAGAAAIAVAQLDLFGPDIIHEVARRRVTADSTRASGVPPVVFITPRAAAVLLGAPVDSVVAGAAGRMVNGDVGFRFAPVDYAARNVVAILRGRDPALRGTYLALTAHNDHVGFAGAAVDHDSLRAYNRVMRPMGADTRDNRAPTAEEQARIRQILDSLRRLRPARPDSIRNGADDDGSGTVAIVEIAEALAGAPERPRRSILFVSHTGEEDGLVGSGWFTDHPTVPRDSIVAEIDEDMVGRGDVTDLPNGGPGYLEVIGAKRLSTEFGEILEAVNAAEPQPFTFNYEYDAPGHPLQYYCRADHYNYARWGIPAVALSRGDHLDYHQVTDEAQYIDYDALARVATLVRDAALRIANLDHRPAVDHPKPDPHGQCVQ